jgi:thioredoxin reductase (NADPH)
VFRKQAEHFGAEVRQEQVYGVDFGSEPKRVVAMDKSYGARAVIIATGAMGRKPSIKGEVELLGMGVSYCAACDAAFYKDKDVAVAGGLDEVIDEVESLVRFARRVYLVTRENELSPEQRAALERLPNVVLKADSRLTAIEGQVTVKGAAIVRGGAEERLDVEGVFLYLHGSRPVTDFLYGALETSPEGCLMVDENMATSIAGVFAVGDVRCKKIRQVVVSTAEGCIAALAAERYINKREKTQPQWSH